MKVILKKEVKGLGKINDIVNVKDGYAKNYLIRNGFAVVVNEKNMQDLKSVLKKEADFQKEQYDKAVVLKEKIEKVELNFSLKAQNCKAFGSVSVSQIIDELKNKNIAIHKYMVVNDDRTFDLGIHFIQIELHKGVVAKLKINVKEQTK